MSIVTLERARAHLNATHHLDDELIQHYIDAAEDYAARFMGRASLDELLEVGSEQSSSEGLRLPASVEQAVLLYVGDFYALREAQVTGTLAQNPAAESLMHFYRVGLGA